MTRIINNIKAIGDIPEGSRVGMVLVGEDLKYDDSVIKLGEFNTLQSNLERMTELQYSEGNVDMLINLSDMCVLRLPSAIITGK